jgi:hypothetical protein
VRFDPAQLFPGGQPATAGALVDRAAVSVLDTLPSAAEHASLLAAFGRAEAAATAQPLDAGPLRPLVGALLASPTFQLR